MRNPSQERHARFHAEDKNEDLSDDALQSESCEPEKVELRAILYFELHPRLP